MSFTDEVVTGPAQSSNPLLKTHCSSNDERPRPAHLHIDLKAKHPDDSLDVFEQSGSISTPNEKTRFPFALNLKSPVPSFAQAVPRTLRRTIRNEAANDRNLQTVEASSQLSARAYWNELEPCKRRLHLALHTAERRSWRPLIQLILVSVGRGLASAALIQLTDVITFGGPDRNASTTGVVQSSSNTTTVVQNPGNITDSIHLGFWLGAYAVREGDNITSVVFGRMRSGNQSVIDAMNQTLPVSSPLPANGSFQDIFFDMAHALLNNTFNQKLNQTLLSSFNTTVQQLTNGTGIIETDNHTLPASVLHSKLAVGASLTVLAAASFAVGAGGFYVDGRKIDKKRAAINSGSSVLGMLMVLASTITTQWGKDINHEKMPYYMIPLRLLGTYLILYSVPQSFAASEIVNGDARIPYRAAVQEHSQAVSSTLFLLYAAMFTISNVPFPIEEVLSGLAVMAAIIGCSLSRTQNERQYALLDNVRRQEDAQEDARSSRSEVA